MNTERRGVCLTCGELVPQDCCTCGPKQLLRPVSLEQAALFEAAPALLNTAIYFNYASNPYNNYEGLHDDAYVTITVTVRAIRDCRQAIKKATPRSANNKEAQL